MKIARTNHRFLLTAWVVGVTSFSSLLHAQRNADPSTNGKTYLVSPRHAPALVVPVSEVKGPKALVKSDKSVGLLFGLINPIKAELLEHDEVTYNGEEGMKGQIVEILENTLDVAIKKGNCLQKPNSDIFIENIKNNTSKTPCGKEHLIIVRGHMTRNLAPAVGTCLCTEKRSFEEVSQKYIGRRSNDEDGDGDQPDNGEEADALLNRLQVLPQAPHDGFIPASGYTVYRPNGTLAEGTHNLAFELMSRKPIVGNDGKRYHLGRLWKTDEGSYEAYNHKSYYAVPASELSPGDLPSEDQSIPPDADVFKGLQASKPPVSSKNINTALPKVGAGQWKVARTVGYYTYNDDDDHVWGRPQTVWTIQEAGRKLAAKGMVASIGDMNRKPDQGESQTHAETTPHASHDHGVAVDIRPMPETGIGTKLVWESAAQKKKRLELVAKGKSPALPPSQTYSAQKTIEMIKAYIDVNPANIKVIYFNDPVVRKAVNAYLKSRGSSAQAQPWANHDNHVHISWKE